MKKLNHIQWLFVMIAISYVIAFTLIAIILKKADLIDSFLQ